MGGARRWVLASLTLVLAGCASASGAATPSPIPAPPTTPQPSLQPAPNNPPALNPTPDPATAIQAALTDAETSLGIPGDQLHVVQVVPRDWPDSSLGCPQPGLMYSQIVTPGFLIVISSYNRQLEYHTDARSRVVLCQQS